ncbi:MAG: DUF3108 domain-containing protein [Gemmatimonadota bacterium]
MKTRTATGRAGAKRRAVGRMFTLALTGSALFISDARAQSPDSTRDVFEPMRLQNSVARVPFGPGEQARYQVKFGPLSVGEGMMQVVDVVPIRGRPSYHVSWVIQGGIPFARVNDHFESWFDIRTLASRRFIQDIHEVRYRTLRHYEIYPEAGHWERVDEDDGEALATDIPLDDIAFIYYVRTLDLEVGETHTLNRYFRADRNPVILEVLRRETIEVPAGTFNTIVVRPIIKAGGLFGEGGEAEVYFTDDDRRILVRLSSKLPIGSLSLHLEEYRPGTPVRR